MFILYAVLIGLVLGFVLGGRLSGLATVDFHWPWLAIGGFVVQLVLFADPVSSVVGGLGPPLYVASTGAVLVAVIRNIRIPGMALVAVGAGANLAAIVANGGFMPASEAAFAALGSGLNAGYTNSTIVADPALEPLTDVYSLPTWLPFANVFSIGDVFIAIGVVIVIVSAMRSWRVAVTAQPDPLVAAEAPAPAPGSPPAAATLPRDAPSGDGASCPRTARDRARAFAARRSPRVPPCVFAPTERNRVRRSRRASLPPHLFAHCRTAALAKLPDALAGRPSCRVSFGRTERWLGAGLISARQANTGTLGLRGTFRDPTPRGGRHPSAVPGDWIRHPPTTGGRGNRTPTSGASI